MAVANTKSTLISNQDAAVQTLNNAALSQGKLYCATANLKTVATDDATSVYRFFPVWSGWRIAVLNIACDALNTPAADCDVGLYQDAKHGGAVVDADCYADGITLAAALTGAINYALVATAARPIEDAITTIWQDAGLTADPFRWYNLCLTLNTTDHPDAGDIVMLLKYVDPAA